MNKLLSEIRKSNNRYNINGQLNEDFDKSERELITKEDLERRNKDYYLKINNILTEYFDENLEIARNSGFTIYASKISKKKKSKSNLTKEHLFSLLKID
jgi:hypothetical protein